MSWFADLAGKAEDFLNKVDQTAAIALQKDEEFSKKKRSSSYSNFADLTSVIAPSMSKSQTLSSPIKKPRTAPENLGKRTWSPVNKPNRTNDDDKLLEFLNSSDANTPKKSSSLPPFKNVEDLVARDQTLEQNANTVVEKPYEQDTVRNDLESNVKDRSRDTQIENSAVDKSWEMENSMLRNEVSSLNQEMSQLLKRVKVTESELQHTRDKLKRFNECSTDNEKHIKELQNRESDLKEALAAKDSQLAILRVRLQEVDDELKQKKETLLTLENERECILNDQSNSSGLHSQALQSLRDRLEENEGALIKERNNFKMAQSELNQRITKLEEENHTLSKSLTDTQRQVLTEKEHNADVIGQLKLTKNSLQSAQQELSDYKQKAQKILQSKEKLIVSLKMVGNSDSGSSTDLGAITASVELEEVKQERDMVREDLLISNGTIEKLRNEIDDLEVQLQNETSLAREQQRNLEEQINNEVKVKDDLIQENSHIKEEIQFMKEETCRQKTMFQSRIADRDTELEKLRKQLTMKVMNNNQNELESRLHMLTENLIHKQTMLEALSTEKNSLVLQLERMEQQMKESQSFIKRGNATTLNVADDTQRRMPEFLVESPFDGQVTRRVKRAYNSVDKFSVRLGIFLRRYPMARIMVIAYMGLLHLFVMVMLLTYSPEIHTENP